MYRDEQFADDVDDYSDSASSRSGNGGSDRRHFDEILAGYRLILTGKRVDPVDIRVKTGWWAESTGAATSSCGSAGKVGPSVSFWTGQSSPVLLHNSRLPSIHIPIPFHYCPDNPPFSSTPFPHLFPILAPPLFLSNNPTREIEMRCGERSEGLSRARLPNGFCPRECQKVRFLANVNVEFTFAICYRPSVCRLSDVCLSVVCNVRAPYSGG